MKGYVEAVQAMEFFAEVETSPFVQQEVDPRMRARLLQAAESAGTLPQYFAEHLHGTASAGRTPDVLTLVQHLRANRALVEEFSARYG